MSDFLSLAPPSVDRQGNVSFGGDERLFVRFFRHARLLAHQSQVEGRPIYENVDMVEIRQPAERDAVHQVVTEYHKQRFPRHWEAYAKGLEAAQTGTPIDVLYPDDVATLQTMKALHIHTVEQLSGLTEEGMKRLGMGGRTHVNRAKSFLAAAQNGVTHHELEAALAAKNDEIAQLRADMEAMRQSIIESNKRKKEAA